MSLYERKGADGVNDEIEGILTTKKQHISEITVTRGMSPILPTLAEISMFFEKELRYQQ